MHNSTKSLPEIQVDQLRVVSGGMSAPMPNQGGPKYSAAWWELVRSGGLRK